MSEQLVTALRRYAAVGGVKARADADARGEAKTNEVDLMLAAADAIEALQSEVARLSEALTRS